MTDYLKEVSEEADSNEEVLLEEDPEEVELDVSAENDLDLCLGHLTAVVKEEPPVLDLVLQ